MTSIAQRLRHLVLNSPRDPDVRSVYADALIQEGDPRGTFIMLQSHLNGRIPPDKREEAKRQVAELLATHGAKWREPASFAQVRFKGGFIHAIQADAATFLTKGSSLLAVEPVLEVNLLDAGDDEVRALAAMPAVAKLAELKLVGSFGDESAALLATSPHLSSLTSLNVKGGPLGKAFAASVANLKMLELLCLTGVEMGDESVSVLAAGAHPALQRLYLARNELSDEGVTALAKSRGLGALRVLCLGGNDISDEGVAAIAASKGLPNLAVLELDSTSVTDEGVEALAKSRTLKALKKLNLARTEVSTEGLNKLQRGKITAVT
jgi:uncharacterized protein (TIGR02996 family)